MKNKNLAYKLIFSVSCFLATAELLAQTKPEDPPVPASSKDNGGRTIIHKKTMSPAEREAYLKKAINIKDDYFVVQGTSDYLTMADQVKAIPGFKVDADQSFQDLITKVGRRGYRFMGTFKEDQYRDTLIFEDDERENLMVTLFRFEDAGATITLYDEFVTRKVNEDPASLSLTVVPGQTKALWKFTAWKKGVSYEVYVPDTVSPQAAPVRKPAEVQAIGELFMSGNIN